ncbi:hypothetical protein [Microvirga sp. 17 mud 1-3]|uniref:hypothetical protein n=1 Tax=Microvirga sp. 17 mud 1-3 TaxID=2082949 RepID=UPI000D6C5E2D|nr:hypothetical protein [Microvirga sp. 17 mud 1-3]AWM88756.1 hypothetical protein C4E04_19870 [Microvirga sp. 17 mud 1-3]
MQRAIHADWDEDEEDDASDGEPLPRSRSRLPWLRMALLSGLSIAALVYFAHEEGSRPLPPGAPGAVPASVLVAPPPPWRPLPQAAPAYVLDKPFAPPVFSARAHISGGREDTFVLGRFGDSRHGRISLVQGDAGTERRSFFVDIVRRAAEAGLSVTRNAQSRMAATKFGPVEMAEVTLAGTAEQTCQAFRFADPETAFGFQGWLCGAEARIVDEAQAACFIDRIALSGQEGLVLKALFARAERNRGEACNLAARTAALSPTPPARP